MVDRKVIYECLGRLQEYFGKELKPEIQKMYIDRIEKLDLDKFKTAMVRIVDEYQPTATNPFPLIKDILEFCGESGQTKAINIIAVVKMACIKHGQYESVNFEDSALHSVIRRYGGWPEVVLWTERDWGFREKSFIEAYKAAHAESHNISHLPGLIEIERDKDGYKLPEPIQIQGGKQKLIGRG